MEYVEKMVMDFYQLDKSPETENNVSQETSINDVSSLNEINISDISIIDKENEWPACKKRKVEVQKRSSNNVACLPGKRIYLILYIFSLFYLVYFLYI